MPVAGVGQSIIVGETENDTLLLCWKFPSVENLFYGVLISPFLFTFQIVDLNVFIMTVRFLTYFIQ